MIRESFPAEHPYSSHVPKFAVFPTFAQVPGDPKRGIAARDNRPKDTEMPANPNDITIIKKIKGEFFCNDKDSVIDNYNTRISNLHSTLCS